MTKLGSLDQAIIKSEQAGMAPMYIATALIVDPGTALEPLDGTMLANHLAACLEEVPLMRQKVVQDDLRIGNMRIVDDPDFDLDNHVTIVEFDEPATYEELTEYLGTFSRQRLDLSRPLWRCEVIEGLEHGHIAIAIQLHHSIMDGTGAQRALASIWSDEPVAARTPRTKAWQSEADVHALSLMSDAVVENIRRIYVDAPTFLVKNSRPILQNLSTMIGKRLQLQRDQETAPRISPPAVQKTSLNEGRLSDRRSVAYMELPLDEIKELRKSYGCTVNDVALFINSWALEHYFREIGEIIDFDLVCTMGVNMRDEGDDSAGNKAGAARVNLHNTIPDAGERLRAIAEDTAEIKRSLKRGQQKKAGQPDVDMETLSNLFSPIFLEALIYGAVRFNLLEKNILTNVNITNVPGFPKPVYLAGARQVSAVPMAPPFDSIALNIAITSTEGLLLIGYHGCGEAIKGKELLVEGARAGFAALRPKAKSRAKTKPKNKTKNKAKSSSSSE